MNSNTRLIVNTLAQNVRTLLNIVLSLYSTRIVMDALGQSDYGIYMLVAGIVSLMSYLSNTLIITTQRHLSFAAGSGDMKGVKTIYANSYLLHWLLGLLLAAVCLSVTSWIFSDGMLKIPADRMFESRLVYFMVVMSVFITLITSPFKALITAHENIVYISMVDVLDGILKLVLVFALYLVEEWRLTVYSVIITGVMLFNFVLLAGYCLRKYEECIIVPRLSMWDTDAQKKIAGFATWTLYGMMCVYVRTQGVAVIVNRMIGTVANAAFGIATQIFGSVQFLSQAIINAISPQIIKAKGANDTDRAIRLSLAESRYCYLLLSIVVIPLTIEMPSVLQLWLKDVPEHTVLFCRMMLIASLLDQITIGLGTLNQARGKIRTYTLITFTTKVMAVPVGLCLIEQGYGIWGLVLSYCAFECLSAFLRLPLLVKSVGVRWGVYTTDVVLRIIPATLVMLVTCFLAVTYIPSFAGRFLLTGILSASTGLFAILLFAMDGAERTTFVNVIIRRFKK